MKIAIVGLGLAGSYLACQLGRRHQVVGFERQRKDRFLAACGWGTSKHLLEKFAGDCGLRFDDYVLHEGREILLDLPKGISSIKLRGLCTFDKTRFIEDIIKSSSIYRVHWEADVEAVEMGFDLVIDATGYFRSLLPKPKEDLCAPSVECLMKFDDPPFDDFYIKPFKRMLGYLWYFPLDNGYAHVGAGDIFNLRHKELADFLKKYPGVIEKRYGRPIRVTPPSRSEPFFQGRVVGVGESIGCIFPLLGEGIIPALQSAEILVENVNRDPTRVMNYKDYRKRILEKFSIYERVYRIVKKLASGGSPSIREVLPVALHLRLHEKRYGVSFSFREVGRVLSFAGSDGRILDN